MPINYHSTRRTVTVTIPEGETASEAFRMGGRENSGAGCFDGPYRIVAVAMPAGISILTFTEAPTDDETVTIDGNVYTFKDTLSPTAGEVLNDSDAGAALDNLIAAVT